MDISVNKTVKEFLRQQFQTWFADKICQQLKKNQADITPVDLRLSVVKPLSAQWMIKLYDHLKKRPDIIVHGFKGTGMFDCIYG